MPLLKIKSDEHGLYIKNNGGIVRPDKCEYDQLHFKRIFKSKFKDGEIVKVSHITQTPLSKLIKDDIIEVWCSHGCYFNGNGENIKSVNIWKPKTIKSTYNENI